MKYYTVKSSAIRAARRALSCTKEELSAKAEILQTSKGWCWQEVESSGTWRRPAPGTKTGRIWELADQYSGDRKKVMAKAKEEGLNLGMAAQQYFRWSHRG